MIITIDGPAGSGKSTAARQLSQALGAAYLDTGAMYRAVTLAALEAGADLADEAALAQLARRLDLRLSYRGGQTVVKLGGRDVTGLIRAARVTDNAHFVARAVGVRGVLVEVQRRIGRELEAATGGVVSEGRDQGSVVFPDADLKFYLDAAPEVRARRRYDEMLAGGQEADYEHVLQAIVTRDGRDRSRPYGPLVKPTGAIEIDTSDKDIPQVTAELLRHVRAARAGPPAPGADAGGRR